MNPEGESGFVTPEIVVSHFHIREGDVVADFGAGSGYYTPELSRRVGNGRVYACEIQKALVEKVGALALGSHLATKSCKLTIPHDYVGQSRLDRFNCPNRQFRLHATYYVLGSI